MDGWNAVGWLATCASGVVVFLALVASAIEQSEHDLRLFEERKRRERASRSEEVIAAAKNAEKAA